MLLVVFNVRQRRHTSGETFSIVVTDVLVLVSYYSAYVFISQKKKFTWQRVNVCIQLSQLALPDLKP